MRHLGLRKPRLGKSLLVASLVLPGVVSAQLPEIPSGFEIQHNSVGLCRETFPGGGVLLPIRNPRFDVKHESRGVTAPRTVTWIYKYDLFDPITDGGRLHTEAGCQDVLVAQKSQAFIDAMNESANRFQVVKLAADVALLAVAPTLPGALFFLAPFLTSDGSIFVLDVDGFLSNLRTLAIAGVGFLLIPGAAGAAATLAALAGASIAAGFGEAYYRRLAADPPDLNYHVVAEYLAPPAPLGVGEPGSRTDRFFSGYLAATSLAAQAQAYALQSLERAEGAFDAGDVAIGLRQLEAHRQFLGDAQRFGREAGEWMLALPELYADLGHRDLEVGPSTTIWGLTRDVGRAFGASSPKPLPDPDPTAVPEPATLGLLATGLAVLCVGRFVSSRKRRERYQ